MKRVKIVKNYNIYNWTCVYCVCMCVYYVRLKCIKKTNYKIKKYPLPFTKKKNICTKKIYIIIDFLLSSPNFQ